MNTFIDWSFYVMITVLEWDEKESKMGVPKRKRQPASQLTPQELATSENLMAVINRLPQVIPNRPLPKPKQKQRLGAGAGISQQIPRDKSDGAASNDPEQLRKWKAYAATHGYKKTVKRIDEYVEKYKDLDDPQPQDDDNLPPVNEERKAQDVSDWVSSTVQVTSHATEEGSGSREEATDKEESEFETIKAIAAGSASTPDVDEAAGGKMDDTNSDEKASGECKSLEEESEKTPVILIEGAASDIAEHLTSQSHAAGPKDDNNAETGILSVNFALHIIFSKFCIKIKYLNKMTRPSENSCFCLQFCRLEQSALSGLLLL